MLEGLVNRVLEATLKELVSLDVVAWFGPCITQKHFEVGQDVYDAFIEQNTIYTQAFRTIGDDKYLFDMKFIARYKCLISIIV